MEFSEIYFVIGKQSKFSTEACGATGALLIHWFEEEDNTLESPVFTAACLRQP